MAPARATRTSARGCPLAQVDEKSGSPTANQDFVGRGQLLTQTPRAINVLLPQPPRVVDGIHKPRGREVPRVNLSHGASDRAGTHKIPSIQECAACKTR